MNKNLTLALTALLVSGFSLQVLAVPPQPARPTLTPEQQARARAARQANRKPLTPQQQQMKQLSDQLRAELKKKPVDQAKVNDLLKQVDDQRNAQQVERLQTMLNDPNLTPQQKQRYNDMLLKVKSRQYQPQQPPAKR